MATLVENEDANEYVRNAALEGMVTLVARGKRSREEILAYFQSLFRGKLVRADSLVWSGLVSACNHLYPEEVMDDIRQAFEDDLVDEMYTSFEFVEEVLASGKEKVLRDLRRDRRYWLIRDTVSEMEWWACFQPASSGLAVREPEKVGRNDPCPCGSGKKYKRCCGRPS